MAQRLRAREEYILPPRNLHYRRGEVFEADNDLYLFLMADAPDVFEQVVETDKALDAPPKDKALRAPRGKK